MAINANYVSSASLEQRDPVKEDSAKEDLVKDEPIQEDPVEEEPVQAERGKDKLVQEEFCGSSVNPIELD